MKSINYHSICLSLIPCFIVFTSRAQIQGKVVDENSIALSFVNVILYRATDSLFVKGSITDELGEFKIIADESDIYRIGLSIIGYKNLYTQDFSFNLEKEIDLGVIALEPEINELDEVVLEARRNVIQATAYGKLINVQSSVMTKGSNSLQILERLPGVLVDKQNNQFSLNGQNGVMVMFNGRRVPLSVEETMALLESTLADNIDHVELITSPSAKYDADGGGGIINIVFKKSGMNGQQVSLNSNLGIGVKEKASTSLQYSYGGGKLSLSSSYSFSHNRSKNGFEGEGTSDMPILGGPSTADFSTYFDSNNNGHNLNLGILYHLTEDTEVGVDLSNLYSVNHTTSDINNIRTLPGQDFLRSHLVTNTRTQRKNFISSLYINKRFSESSRLNVEMGNLSYSNDSPANTQSVYFDDNGNTTDPENDIFTDGNRGQSLSKINLLVLKADYSQRLSDQIEFEIGAKSSLSKNENDSKIETESNGEWIVDPRSQSLITSKEILWAAYTEVKYAPTDKTMINAGIRYEDWERTISGEEEPFKIQQIFPSFSYQYTLGENQNLRASYQKRISRPSYTDLVSSLYYNDPTAVFTGNPLLKPAITNTLALDYSFKGYNVGVSYQKEQNPIFRNQFTSTDAYDILIVSPQNGEYQRSLNFSLTLTLQWASWAKLNVNSTSSFRKYAIAYTEEAVENAYFFQNINFNQSIQLTKKWDMEISGWYNFPSYNGSHITQGFGIVNFGMAKEFENNWGTLRFTITDIFKSFRINTHNGGAAPVVFDIDTESTYRDESAFSRIFSLGYSLNLGNFSGKKLNKKISVEEMNRVN